MHDRALGSRAQASNRRAASHGIRVIPGRLQQAFLLTFLFTFGLALHETSDCKQRCLEDKCSQSQFFNYACALGPQAAAHLQNCCKHPTLSPSGKTSSAQPSVTSIAAWLRVFCRVNRQVVSGGVVLSRLQRLHRELVRHDTWEKIYHAKAVVRSSKKDGESQLSPASTLCKEVSQEPARSGQRPSTKMKQQIIRR